MSNPHPRPPAAITRRAGAGAIADIETQHRMAESALSGAEGALQEASAKYDAALGEGREAALAARQVRTTAEVDLDIARRNVDTLGRKLADAHEALRLAGIEHKRTEAERLRSVFEETARQALARMSVDARVLLRAWAEAELATQAACEAQGRDGPPIPSAEDFRSVPRMHRREIGRTRITRWLRPGTNDAYGDEIDRTIIGRGATGWLRNEAMLNGGHEVSARGEFDRITYAEATAPIYMPLLAESLSIPALVGGQVPGWLPIDARDPRAVLAQLVELERAPASKAPQHETADVFVQLVGANPAAASA